MNQLAGRIDKRFDCLICKYTKANGFIKCFIRPVQISKKNSVKAFGIDTAPGKGQRRHLNEIASGNLLLGRTNHITPHKQDQARYQRECNDGRD